MTTKGGVTPLWIVAAFVTLTETILGYAVTKTTGGVQIALTSFVMLFAVLVAGAFFVVLWHKPYVFYPPSEYGSLDPRKFVEAMSPRVLEQVEMVRTVEQAPADKSAQFSLIDSLIDDTARQHLILMFEKSLDLPYSDFAFGHKYSLGTQNKHWADGMFGSREFVQKLEGTRFVEIVQSNGVKLRLTSEGQSFAKWLMEKGRKSDFLVTPFGGWGTPTKPGEESKKGNLAEPSAGGNAAPPRASA